MNTLFKAAALTAPWVAPLEALKAENPDQVRDGVTHTRFGCIRKAFKHQEQRVSVILLKGGRLAMIGETNVDGMLFVDEVSEGLDAPAVKKALDAWESTGALCIQQASFVRAWDYEAAVKALESIEAGNGPGADKTLRDRYHRIGARALRGNM